MNREGSYTFQPVLIKCWIHITLVSNSNDPPWKYCILDVIKRLINQSRLVKTGPNWSKLSKLVETCNGLPCSKTNRTFIWTFLNLIFLLSDTSNHGWHSMFYESLIILNISPLNFSEGVPASVITFKWGPFVLQLFPILYQNTVTSFKL